MKEFQAENDRRQSIVDDKAKTMLDANSNEMIVGPSTPDDACRRSSPSIPSKQNHFDHQPKVNSNTSDRRTPGERNRIPTKTPRLTSDTPKVRLCSLNFVSFSLRPMDPLLLLEDTQAIRKHRLSIRDVIH